LLDELFGEGDDFLFPDEIMRAARRSQRGGDPHSFGLVDITRRFTASGRRLTEGQTTQLINLLRGRWESFAPEMQQVVLQVLAEFELREAFEQVARLPQNLGVLSSYLSETPGGVEAATLRQSWEQIQAPLMAKVATIERNQRETLLKAIAYRMARSTGDVGIQEILGEILEGLGIERQGPEFSSALHSAQTAA
jgi:hypothetical protein